MRRAVDTSGLASADVAHDELHGPADRGIGPVALAEHVAAEFMPISRAIGPLTMMMGPTSIVVASTPCMLKSSVQIASTAAITTGR